MRQVLIAVLCLCVLPMVTPCPGAASTNAKPLQIYFIDVEGGQATLIVSPSGQSLLIDAGWPGYEGRDADRIVAVAHQAGLKQLDYVLITHYHRDHVGGIPQLADGIKIGTFVDHGPNLEELRGYARRLRCLREDHCRARPRCRQAGMGTSDQGNRSSCDERRGRAYYEPTTGSRRSQFLLRI